jgi:hypothetical protein
MTMTTMIGSYKVMLRCRPNDVQLLVTDMGDDILKAQLDSSPAHPRALVTLLEGLALWQGEVVCVAVSASEGAQDCCERVLYGGGLLGPVSPLVSVEHRLTDRRPRRLRGLGDFRQLRLLGGAW